MNVGYIQVGICANAIYSLFYPGIKQSVHKDRLKVLGDFCPWVDGAPHLQTSVQLCTFVHKLRPRYAHIIELQAAVLQNYEPLLPASLARVEGPVFSDRTPLPDPCAHALTQGLFLTIYQMFCE